MSDISKRERLEAAFAGECADRPPVALWRHWPGDDQNAADLARAQIAFQERYDWDFMKVTPASEYCTADWGVKSVYQGDMEGTRQYIHRRVSEPEDWAALPVLDPSQGALGRQLRCLELISERVGDAVPFIQTIFNPISMAGYLAGPERMWIHMRQHPDLLRQGLEIITETCIRFVRRALDTGAAGIYFAVQHAKYDVMSVKEYQTFGETYDRRVLEAVSDAWFNLAHLHGNDLMFDLLSAYPAQVINWHDRETPPTLGEAQPLVSGAVCGGLRQWDTMVRGTPEQIAEEARDAIEQTGGRGFVLGTGCVTPIVTPTRNLYAVRQAVEGTSKS